MTTRSLPHKSERFIKLCLLKSDLIRRYFKSTTKSTRILATLLLILSITFGSLGSRNFWVKRRAEKEQGRRLLRKNSGLRNKDGSRVIFVPYKNTTSKVTIYPTKATTFDAHRRLFLNPPRASGLSNGSVPQVPPAQTKTGFNLAFLHQFLSLLNIMVPRWTSKETGLLLSHGVFLMLRTYLSLVVARLDGEIVRDLVAGNGRSFIWGIFKWCGIGSFASYTNAMIKFLQSKVSISFRTRLTRYIHDLYLNDNLNYYRLVNIDGGVGQGVDQFITQDLTHFCASAANLYSSIGKPFVDLIVFNYQLYCSLGPLGLTGLMSNYILTAILLRKMSPPFGKLKAVEVRKEGDFRFLHARLIANAEEVAFYGGASMENYFLQREFKSLKNWMEGIYALKIQYNILEDFILKYSWSAYGYLLSSLPIFFPAWAGLGGVQELAEISVNGALEKSRMKDFITNKRLMLSLADAGGRMMYSIKDISELAGYTSRVYSLISTLHRVHADAYFPPRGIQPELFSLSDVQGTIQKGFDGMRLERVPVVAPSIYPLGGEQLIESLSLVIHSGDHLLISGPNGVGKSAVARIVAGLWPVYRGLVSRSRNIGTDGIFFLPQRPYLSAGTLRDQVIYPHGAVDMNERGWRDAELQRVLDEAYLGYLPEREGGWDIRKEWKDVLSGGEKQRMSIARLFYHEPRYAFIDEGTSAVSSDVEGLLYEKCKEKGITLITISTRASLKKYHRYNLSLGMGDDGNEWEFEKIGTEKEKLEVERELKELTECLDKVPDWLNRKIEIEKELSKVWIEGGVELEESTYTSGQNLEDNPI
ncbi:Peroxisomal long-chain fatty acid import protein 2 [Erysiphe necator]|nr:Peroxisomal long-chain fatty acid import protein 2 [Erysiphe necator]